MSSKQEFIEENPLKLHSERAKKLLPGLWSLWKSEKSTSSWKVAYETR